MPKSLVVIDGRMVTESMHGIGRYVSLLAAGLPKSEEIDCVFLRSPSTPERLFAGCSTHPVAAPFLSPREWLEVPSVLSRLGATLFHSPSFCSFWRLPCPSVVTVHDLNHLKFGGIAQRLYYRGLLRPFIKNSRAVLTVSEFSRAELARWMGWGPERIEVVWNAIDPELGKDVASAETQTLLSEFGVEPRRYFLSLINDKPHKNAKLLAEAHSKYSNQEAASARWPLLTVGMKPLTGLSVQKIRVLLSQAGAVVAPSLYEGFGLPPVEALAAGTPVLASRIAPHEEGLSDAAPGEVHWVGADDFHGWVSALGHASRGEMASVSRATRDRILDRFSPARLGVHMDRVYRRVLYGETHG